MSIKLINMYKHHFETPYGNEQWDEASNINDLLKSMYSETSIEAGPQLSGHPLLSGHKSQVPKLMYFCSFLTNPYSADTSKVNRIWLISIVKNLSKVDTGLNWHWIMFLKYDTVVD